MAKATFDLKTLEIPDAAAKPLYAGVGAGDLAYTAVKEYVSDVHKRVTSVQKDVSTRVTDVQKQVRDFDPIKLRQQARSAATSRRHRVEGVVSDLQSDARKLPSKVQEAVESNLSTATATYGDLVKRGEAVVTKFRTGQPVVAVEVKTTATKLATVKTEATTSSKPAKKAPARKAAAKRTTAKKTTAKKAPARKTAAKKTTTS